MLLRYLFIFLLVINLAFAFESQSSSQIKSGVLFVETNSEQTFQKDMPISIRALVYNDTGILLTGSQADCKLHYYDQFNYINFTASMDENGDGFNYTLSKSNTNRTGFHNYDIYCNSTSYGGFRSGQFEITNNGKHINDFSPISIAVILIGITIVLFAIALGVDQKEHVAIKLFFLIAAILMVIVNLNFAYSVALENGLATAMQSTLLVAYKISIYSAVVFLGYYLIYLIYQILTKSKQG